MKTIEYSYFMASFAEEQAKNTYFLGPNTPFGIAYALMTDNGRLIFAWLSAPLNVLHLMWGVLYFWQEDEENKQSSLVNSLER